MQSAIARHSMSLARKVASIASCVLSFHIAAGCGSQDDAGDSEVERVSDAAALLVDGWCYELFHCPSPSDDVQALAATLASESRCQSVLHGWYERKSAAAFRDLSALEDAGAVHVDPEAAAACAEQTHTCGAGFGESVGPCREMYEGNAQAGDACYRSEQCAGDAFCDMALSACPGVCAPRKVRGESCRTSDECQNPSGGIASCGFAGAARVCGGIVVVGESDVGDACGQIEGSEQLDFRSCREGSWCDIEPFDGATLSVAGICRAPIAIGERCDDSNVVCAQAGLCFGLETQTCLPVELRRAGQACGDDGDETVAVCDIYGGFTCGDSDACVPLGDGSQDSRCNASPLGDLIGCGEGLYCERVSETCQLLRATAQSCTTDESCDSGECDQISGRCRAMYCDGNSD